MEPKSHTINNMSKYLSRTTLIVIGIVIGVLLIAVGVLGWKYYQVSKDNSDDSKEISAKIIQKVAALYMIPTNEEPTVARIQDKNKLENQDFFKNASNGDYLLVYQKNKVALVYREQNNKLVNVGPVNIENNSGETAGAQTESEAPKDKTP